MWLGCFLWVLEQAWFPVLPFECPPGGPPPPPPPPAGGSQAWANSTKFHKIVRVLASRLKWAQQEKKNLFYTFWKSVEPIFQSDGPILQHTATEGALLTAFSWTILVSKQTSKQTNRAGGNLVPRKWTKLFSHNFHVILCTKRHIFSWNNHNNKKKKKKSPPNTNISWGVSRFPTM